MKVYLSLNPRTAPDNNGIGRVVKAQYEYLPSFGIELTENVDKADIIACHIRQGDAPRIDVLHCHGMYFVDVPHSPYSNWHHSTNHAIAKATRAAYKVTVPSNWVAEPYRRDMRINPVIIGHGVDIDEWKKTGSESYILWNKGRNDDVCDPTPALELARAGFGVISTFLPQKEKEIPGTMKVCGVLPFDEMKNVITSAGIYLATTLETFGIGTVEAMASGVPVLGYDWGGTAEIVRHKIDGYLVKPGDTSGLIEGAQYIYNHYFAMSKSAAENSRKYDWKNVIGLYADLYKETFEELRNENKSVSIVIPCHNYGKYVKESIKSCLNQTVKPDEIIVVDDGSTDDSREVIDELKENNKNITTIYQENQGVSGARNAGIERAKSSYIICLDADDQLSPQFIEATLPVLRKDRGIGIAYTGITIVNNGSSGYSRDWPPEFNWSLQSRQSVPPANVIPSACMFRKSMWVRAGGFRQEYAPGEDAEFWTRGLSIGYSAKRATPDGLFLYNIHPGSASRTKKYVAIDDRMPWIRDKEYPFAAPVKDGSEVIIRSYLFPAVSVIIPVGPGHENSLFGAIESVIGQTAREWEIIVVDDTCGSLDKGKFSAYPFIRWYSTNEKHGAGVARNIGIDHAKGKAVLFLDADDFLMPTAIEMLAKYYDIMPCGYVYGDWSVVENGVIVNHESSEYNQFTWRMQHPVTVLMGTQDAKRIRFDEELPSWEDWDFFLKTAVNGICGHRVPIQTLFYNSSTGSRRSKVISTNEVNKLGEEILKELSERYGAYFERSIPMSKCCGGDASKEILEIKNRISGNISSLSEEKMPDLNVRVRVEYIGTNAAPIAFRVDGRVYRGANSPLHKWADAPLEDAKSLEMTGSWRIVNMPQEDKTKIPSTDEVVARQLNAAEIMARNQALINKAKEEAERQSEKEMAEVEADSADELSEFLEHEEGGQKEEKEGYVDFDAVVAQSKTTKRKPGRKAESK